MFFTSTGAVVVTCEMELELASCEGDPFSHPSQTLLTCFRSIMTTCSLPYTRSMNCAKVGERSARLGGSRINSTQLLQLLSHLLLEDSDVVGVVVEEAPDFLPLEMKKAQMRPKMEGRNHSHGDKNEHET